MKNNELKKKYVIEICPNEPKPNNKRIQHLIEEANYFLQYYGMDQYIHHMYFYATFDGMLGLLTCYFRIKNSSALRMYLEFAEDIHLNGGVLLKGKRVDKYGRYNRHYLSMVIGNCSKQKMLEKFVVNYE